MLKKEEEENPFFCDHCQGEKQQQTTTTKTKTNSDRSRSNKEILFTQNEPHFAGFQGPYVEEQLLTPLMMFILQEKSACVEHK